MADDMHAGGTTPCTTPAPARFNAAELLLQRGADEAPALHCGNEVLVYRELRQRVAQAGAAWRALGVGVGERVLIGLPDGIEAVLAYLGALWCGAVAVAISPRTTAAQWRELAAQSQARRILVPEAVDLPAALAVPALAQAVWRQAREAAAPLPPLPLPAEAPAAWSYSSGTSGTPKAVVHAHRFALGVQRVAAECLGITAGDRLFASSRLFFVYPLANSLLAGLKLGACVVLTPEWPSPAGALKTLTSHRPTVFFTVPSLLRDLLLQGHAAALAGSGLRLAVCAGEALPDSLRQAWQLHTRVPLVNGYGASETMCLVLVDLGDGLQPAPGVQIRWADEGAGATGPGRLWLRAPTQALGYWQRPQEQAATFVAEGFSPADLFEPGPRGSWRFAGREDSLVKISGRWVDLAALSEQLATPAGTAGAVLEAAAVAVPDDAGLLAVAVFYVARADAQAEAARELAERAAALSTYQRPRWLHAVPELPRTPTGKLLRRQLQQMHGVLLRARAAS